MMIELEDPDRHLRLHHCTMCLIYKKNLDILTQARPVMDPETGRLRLYCEHYDLKDVRLRTLVEFFDPVLRKRGGIFCLCSLLIRRNPDFPHTMEPWIAECRVLRIHENMLLEGGRVRE